MAYEATICRVCQATVMPGSIFCSKCGTRVDGTAVLTDSQTPSTIPTGGLTVAASQQAAMPVPAQSVAGVSATPVVPTIVINNFVSPTVTATANPTVTTTATSGAAPMVVMGQGGPGMLVRIVYFLFVGWWLGLLVSTLAWTLNITIIGLPLGIYLLNRLPAIITLRPEKQTAQVVGGVLVVQGQQQLSLTSRATYFLLVGWWFSALWLTLAYACVLSIILLPLAFWMYERAAAVTTLYRH